LWKQAAIKDVCTLTSRGDVSPLPAVEKERAVEKKRLLRNSTDAIICL
jgi:hypothetical protein